MTDVLLAQPRPPALQPAPPRAVLRRRRLWVSVAAAVVLFGASLGYLLSDAAQANHRFDRARHTLFATRATTTVVSRDLAIARSDLNLVTQQVGSDTTALSQDTSELQGAQTALSAAQAHVSAQAALLNSLHTCLGGVEQALNALAVDNQIKAAASLLAVAPSCSAAVNASG